MFIYCVRSVVLLQKKTAFGLAMNYLCLIKRYLENILVMVKHIGDPPVKYYANSGVLQGSHL